MREGIREGRKMTSMDAINKKLGARIIQTMSLSHFIYVGFL